MKLRRISCTQFAGIRDRDVSFRDGINVVFGKNESGKSTMVHLLSRTLFQNAKLDNRRDKEFHDLYFPAAKKGSKYSGDFADGKVEFETENGVYTLSKEWGADHRCVLSAPDGVVRDAAVISELLKEAMVYGEGVYGELLFSSQRNTALSLQTLLDASKKSDMKQELTEAVSQAFAESDGISLDAVEQAIQKNIDVLAGKHWDPVRRAPVQNKRWSKDLGEILKAYYAVQDARAVLDERCRLERQADQSAAAFLAADAEADTAAADCEDFRIFFGQLQMRQERRKAAERLQKELVKYAEVLSAWPKLVEKAERAKQLRQEVQWRGLLDRYEAVQALAARLRELDAELRKQPCPEDCDLHTAKRALNTIAAMENSLCGMNLSATLRMFGDYPVEIRSLRTGKVLPVKEEYFALTEAVTVSVAGVMELQLAPANVDAALVEQQIEEQREVLAALFARFGVENLEAMETLSRVLLRVKTEADSLRNKLSVILDGRTYEELEAAVQKIPASVSSAETLEAEIRLLCGGREINQYLAASETILEGYAKEYGTPENLRTLAEQADAEYRKAIQEAQAGAELPEAYLSVTDPQTHLERLQWKQKDAQQKREAALTEKTAAASRLQSHRENGMDDPLTAVEEAERIFVETESLLNHWLHIAEVFAKQKEGLQNNPMEDIADNFARNLSLLSGGTVSSEFPDAEKLQMQLFTGTSLVDYGKLSEGTKETVSLAFRLAVLDHLFPDGGGVIVLDDPLTDMDAERTAASCNLIRDCADRHQVIFLTCREEYLTLLPGNKILL